MKRVPRVNTKILRDKTGRLHLGGENRDSDYLSCTLPALCQTNACPQTTTESEMPKRACPEFISGFSM